MIEGLFLMVILFGLGIAFSNDSFFMTITFQNYQVYLSAFTFAGLIVGIIIVVLGIVVIALNSKIPDYKAKSVDEWYNDVINNKEVLTIYGASYCSHCQEYYPVISKIANKYNINLYFFEVDELQKNSPESYEKLMNSFEIKDYEGSVPFTFIMRNGNYVTSTTGFATRELSIEFLKENGIIKN